MNSASPVQLVVMLYDAALKNCGMAKRAMEEGDLEAQHAALTKAQRILSELTASLDMQAGGEIAQNLFGLYSYCYNLLVDANVTDDPVPIDAATKVLGELRNAWYQIWQNPPQELKSAA